MQLQAKRDRTSTDPEAGPEGGPVSEGIEARIQSKRSSGTPLDDGTRSSMETAFGESFEGVRVHWDGRVRLAQPLARCQGVYHGERHFLPSGRVACHRQLLGHELTHVVQQRSGAVSGGSGMTLGPADDALEQAADAAAGVAIASGDSASSGVAALGAAPVAPAPAVAQRKNMSNSDPVFGGTTTRSRSTGSKVQVVHRDREAAARRSTTSARTSAPDQRREQPPRRQLRRRLSPRHGTTTASRLRSGTWRCRSRPAARAEDHLDAQLGVQQHRGQRNLRGRRRGNRGGGLVQRPDLRAGPDPVVLTGDKSRRKSPSPRTSRNLRLEIGREIIDSDDHDALDELRFSWTSSTYPRQGQGGRRVRAELDQLGHDSAQDLDTGRALPSPTARASEGETVSRSTRE